MAVPAIKNQIKMNEANMASGYFTVFSLLVVFSGFHLAVDSMSGAHDNRGHFVDIEEISVIKFLDYTRAGGRPGVERRHIRDAFRAHIGDDECPLRHEVFRIPERPVRENQFIHSPSRTLMQPLEDNNTGTIYRDTQH